MTRYGPGEYFSSWFFSASTSRGNTRVFASNTSRALTPSGLLISIVPSGRPSGVVGESSSRSRGRQPRGSLVSSARNALSASIASFTTFALVRQISTFRQNMLECSPKADTIRPSNTGADATVGSPAPASDITSPRVPSPAATGGAGTTFEQHAGAYWLAQLLVGAIPPILIDATVAEVSFQTERLGWHTDDFVVACTFGGVSRNLAGQVKRSFTRSEERRVGKEGR